MLVTGFAAAMLTAFPAHAQFGDGFNFLKAVKDRDGTKATEYIEAPGSVIINTQDVTSGETALHLVVEDKDTTWTGFLLQKGADPNKTDKKGVTPLMLATQVNFVEGVEWLLKEIKTTKFKTDVDQRNRSGETALIRAVQLNNERIAELLLDHGADADISDYSGYSARDYAERDNRKKPLLALIEASDRKRAQENGKQPELDFSGIGNEL